MRRPESLRRQLLYWLVPSLLLIFAVNVWFGNRAAVRTADESFDRLLVASARVIAEDMALREGRLVVELPHASLELLESDPNKRLFYRVVAPDGATATGADDLPLPRHLDPASTLPVLYTEAYAGNALHFAALNRRLESDAATPAVIVVAETAESRDAMARHLLVEGLLRQSLLIAVALVVLSFALRRGLGSLDLLRDRLALRPAADLSPIDLRGVQAEVRPIVEALNTHTSRLARVLDGREQFIADASHQMRTPLAEMRTQIEYGLRHGDDEMRRETLRDVHAGIDALGRLIGQLMLLARSDPAAIDDPRTHGVDLGRLARSTALDLVPAARARAIHLRFEPSAGRVIVAGNEVLLHELLVNLLDNAIRHGRQGGDVAVRVSGYPQATLEVEDDGPGIAEADRERVFERFYRGRDVAAPGSGLGLAIVSNICRAHRASIGLLTPASGSGVCVRVCFAPRHLLA